MGRSCASKPDFVYGRDLAHEAWRTRQGSFVAACASLVWPDILGDEPRRLAPLQPREAHIMGRSCASIKARQISSMDEIWLTRPSARGKAPRWRLSVPRIPGILSRRQASAGTIGAP